jgi:hypothetical protein
MIYDHAVDDSSPGSPPELSESKSSHSSSFNSLGSNDDADLADVGNFEDITLEDNNNNHRDTIQTSDHQHKTAAVSPYSPAFPHDLRHLRHKAASTTRLPYLRDLSSTHASRDVLAVPKNRPTLPTLTTQVRGVNVQTTSLGLLPEPYTKPLPRRSLGSRSSTSSVVPRQRSKSPSLHLDPRDPKLMARPRRSSWQSNRRKSSFELELECDEDDGDDIPDGLVLDNVPISPRPPQERAKSQPASKSPSPERPKERVRSVGNGTPPVAAARGSLRSPMWKSDTAVATLKSSGPSPVGTRAKSWTAALAELNADAKALTEKLEEHAEELEHKAQRSSTGSMPNPRRSPDHEAKPRVRSALPELPPLRRTNIMIDPLPISKEKEAVLSRTRPSWLPPKDPAEERRHLKEYQKMMARSAEAERRRDADKRVRSEHRDQAADGLQHIWEEDILPRWNTAIRERRTRELWWRGIAPRSRGQVWSRAIGNELGLNEASYQAALRRAREVEARAAAGNGSADDVRQAAWFAAIRQDVEEHTWKDLRIFQAGAPLHHGLVDVLSAYAMYRSDIGYVSGCNVSLPSPLPPNFTPCITNDPPDNRRPAPPQPPLPIRSLHLPRQHPQPAPPAVLLRLRPGRQGISLQPPPPNPLPQIPRPSLPPRRPPRPRRRPLPLRRLRLPLHHPPIPRRGRAPLGRVRLRRGRGPGARRRRPPSTKGDGAARGQHHSRSQRRAAAHLGGDEEACRRRRCAERRRGEVDSGCEGSGEGVRCTKGERE